MNPRFFKCSHCGNLVGVINDSKVPMWCCGEKMQELIAQNEDLKNEKHTPVVAIKDNVLDINVGSINHPMEENHFIEWVYVHTTRGGKRFALKPNDAPYVRVVLDNEEAIAVYAYCNIHGLWVKNL